MRALLLLLVLSAVLFVSCEAQQQQQHTPPREAAVTAIHDVAAAIQGMTLAIQDATANLIKASIPAPAAITTTTVADKQLQLQEGVDDTAIPAGPEEAEAEPLIPQHYTNKKA
jgi:hypothetical protein